ncbi:COP9 signalosome complex subunit 5-like [Sycon ciliatum]|uniref:COP9 signalosome complex subunit 5-like n=1 Tax=Sycon ciliatum TaxID=27933 RepID=UPI0031F71059
MDAMDVDIARATFELENEVSKVASVDEIFHFNAEEQKEVQSARPWSKDPNYFKEVKISALALLKMVMHARSGGQYEIMGLMTGKVDGNTMIVLDSFALPVQGTETRVNAQSEANEYMVEYKIEAEKIGRNENAIGWYHSHPGYGCWLSGIDCHTQMNNQTFQEPFVAVVIDPVRTISAGKVNLGAFRTYPKNYKAAQDSEQSEYQSIPLDKIEDFGVHAKEYYQLDVSYFKSSTDSRMLDLLWNKYWLTTLSASPLFTNASYLAEQIADIAKKISDLAKGEKRPMALLRQSDVVDPKLHKISCDGVKASSEAIHGLIAQGIKECLFNFAGSRDHGPSGNAT